MRKVLTTLAGVAFATTVATSAHADPSGTLDWGKALVDLDAYARGNAERPDPSAASDQQSQRHDQLYVQNAGNAWFGVAPSVSLVARDWGSAYRIAGDRLSLVDAMRLSESTRMVMSRVRFSNTRIAPFMQLGVGQWRTDTNILPYALRSVDIATQVGGGVEIRLGRGWQLATEASATMLIRDQREYENLPATKLWSTTIASRLVF